MSESVKFFMGATLLILAFALATVFDFDPSFRASNEVTTLIFADVKPIFKDRCSKCHSSGALDWTKYENAFAHKDAIRIRVAVFKNMPPAGQYITDEERYFIKKWVDEGAHR